MFSNITDFFSKYSDLLFTNTSYRNTIINYVLLLSIIIFSSIVLFYANTNPNALYRMSDIFIYFAIIIIPLYFTYSTINKRTSTIDNDSLRFGMYALGLMFGIYLVYNYIDLSDYNFELAKYVFYIMVLFAVIIGLSITFSFIGNYLRSLDGVVGFVSYLIFYIPCMINDFVRYLLKEFKATTKDVYILLGIEILLILGLIYLPPYINKALTVNGTELLKESMFLEKKRNIHNSQDIALINNDNEPITFRTKYGISMWVYINPESNANSSYKNGSEIFNYNGKPMLKFKNNEINQTNTLSDPKILRDEKSPYSFIVVFSNVPNDENDLEQFEITLPLQKWNNFVFNYNGNTVDVFVNGKLVKTHVLQKMPQYLVTDTFSIGDNNGLKGSISNIKYHNEPLTKSQITYMYNFFSKMNPPYL